MKNKTYIVFDTETTGLPPKGGYNKPHTDTDNWPRTIQIAWSIYKGDGTLIKRESHMITPPDGGYVMEHDTVKFHMRNRGIDIVEDPALTRQQNEAVALLQLNGLLAEAGKPLSKVLAQFVSDAWKSNVLVAHNINFDTPIIKCEIFRVDQELDGEWEDLEGEMSPIMYPPAKGEAGFQFVCTMLGMQKMFGKWPKLDQLYHWCFGKGFENAHDAGGDVTACADSFFYCVQKGFLKVE